MTPDWLLIHADALLKIIGINLVLSGDNALLIAMATRGLPRAQKRLGLVIGVIGAILLRILLSLGLWKLLEFPGLHLIGGLALIVIALQLSPHTPEDDSGVDKITPLGFAIRQIIIGDAMMSADNVLAVAAAAKGDIVLMSLGIALCIPFITVGTELLSQLIKRWSFILVMGSTLLGWVAGELLNSDVTLDYLKIPNGLQNALPEVLAIVIFIVASSRWLRGRRTMRKL